MLSSFACLSVGAFKQDIIVLQKKSQRDKNKTQPETKIPKDSNEKKKRKNKLTQRGIKLSVKQIEITTNVVTAGDTQMIWLFEIPKYVCVCLCGERSC